MTILMQRRRGASYNPIAARPRLVVSGGVGTLLTTENFWQYLPNDEQPTGFPVSAALFGSFGVHGQVRSTNKTLTAVEWHESVLLQEGQAALATRCFFRDFDN